MFYLVPTAWVAAQAGRRAGMGMAVLSGLVAITADVLTQPHYRHRAVVAWNAILLLVTLSIVVELVHRIRGQALAALDAEQRSRDFLASAAHQLRTPVAGIGSTVDALLLGGEHDSEEEQLLANLRREATRAGRQIAGLLRMARIDQHEPVPARPVRIADAVRAELERAATTGPSLAWRLADAADGIEAMCNPDAVGEAVANLLDNAGRHAETRVDVTVRAADRRVEIAVSDDGPGLRPDAAAAAFERFVSLDGCGGTGLGLPIARGIAEAHGGSLTYRNGEFVLTLPVP